MIEYGKNTESIEKLTWKNAYDVIWYMNGKTLTYIKAEIW